jgi:deferrochelatase/peroxidase EfeB
LSATSAIRAPGSLNFDNSARFDMLNQFATHTGGGLFACPGGIAKGEFIGQRLFAAA